ncbi:MAG: M23 family metallopeptidase [Candidatus Riflebacteria bacterium]|nr:M23 family metallopeptidase [Candidatus Riflebacteria bacterium]
MAGGPSRKEPRGRAQIPPCPSPGLDILALLLAGLLLCAGPARAGFPPEGRLTVSSFKARPGEILVVGVRGCRGVERLEGRFLNRSLSFARSEEGDFEALAGIDLEDKPGFHRVTVYLVSSEGETTLLRKDVEVKPGQFAVDRLTVGENMIEFDEEAEDRIREEQRRMEQALAGRTPRQFGTRFALPVQGQVSSSFGRRRMFNGKLKAPHSGTDLKAPLDTVVRAPAEGTVVLAESQYLPGNVVILDHGCGVLTGYFHLKESRVEPGQVVRPGEPIGFVGMTGRVTGPHLHWMCRVGGARVDPMHLGRLRLAAPSTDEPEPPEPEEADPESRS